MEFRKDVPQAPGLYWYRLAEDSHLYHCQVWRRHGTLIASTGEGRKPVTEFERLWSTDFLAEPKVVSDDKKTSSR